MDIFLVLQVLFDAVLLFGVLFLFHFSVHQSQKKREEWDILKNIQVQEIKENLQELLMTLKQLGKEVSDNIQEQVREAEEKTEAFKKALSRLQKDFAKVTKLAEEVDAEKNRLEDKIRVIETAKKNTPKFSFRAQERILEKGGTKQELKKMPRGFGGPENGIGFSSGVVREVYRLSDEKTEMNEIVQRTKLSRAEIQLILNLRGNGFATPN